MADLKKTIEIVFQGTDRVADVASSVSRKLGDLNSTVGSLTGPMARAADSIMKTDAALAALAAGGLAYAFHKSVQFESATIDLKKVMGDQVGLLGQAKDKAIELSDKYGVSSSNILQSMANFKQAGFEVRDSMILTNDALNLVIAGDVDMAQASEQIVSSLKGFKAPAEDAARLVDILNEVSNRYATNVGELATGMAGISPIAKQMGFSMEETAGIITPVIEVFRSGSEASTALKSGLTRLIDDSAPVTAALSQLGVAQKDVNGNLRSGKDILHDVAKAFEAADQNTKMFLTSELVGREQAARLVEVFDSLAKTTEITGVALNSAGSALEEVKARLASSEVAIDRFQTGFANLAIVIGDRFREAAQEAIEGGTEIETALRNAVTDGSFDPVFKALSGFGQEVGQFFKDVAKVIPEALAEIDFTQFLAAFSGLRLEISDYFDGVDLTTKDGLKMAIEGTLRALTALVNVTAGMVDAFEPAFNAILAFVDKFSKMDAATRASVGELLGWSKVISGLTGVLDGLGSAMNALATLAYAQVFKGGLELVGNMGAIKDKAGVLTTALSSIGPVALTVAKTLGAAGLGGALGYAIGTLMRENIPVVKEFGDRLGELAFKAMNGTGTAQAKMEAFQAQAKADYEYILMLKGKLESEGTLPAAAPVKLDVDDSEARERVEQLNQALKGLPDKHQTEIEVLTDQDAAQATLKELEKKFPFEQEMKIKALDDGSIEIIAGKIARAAPDKKEVKVEVDTDKVKIARIQQQGETLRHSFEWSAKLNISQVEAETRKVEAAFKSIDATISSTGDVISNLFKGYSSMDVFEQGSVERQLRGENRRRDEALKLQKRLAEVQIELGQARVKAIEKGDALIKIEADGVEPEVEAFMFKILSKIQLRVKEEQADFLLGIGQ